MLKQTRQAFENGKLKKMKYHLQGVHTYDILRNPMYIEQFQYFSADLPNRHEYIVDRDEDETNDVAQSDLVRLVLNLAFLDVDEAKKIDFNPQGLAMLEERAKDINNKDLTKISTTFKMN